MLEELKSSASKIPKENIFEPQWIALLAVPAVFSWWHILAAFVLFRFFDIVKPLGVRKMENFKGGWGIMADDVLAGIYGAIVLHLITAIPW